MNPQNDEIEIDLLEILYVIKSKILIVLASMLVAGLLTGLYSVCLAEPVYESTARMYILTKTTSLTSLADIQMGTSLTQDYKELITSRTVVEQVIHDLDLSLTYGQMVERINVENPSNTRIIKITVQDNVAEDAKTMVDQLMEVSREKISSIMATEAPSVIEYGNLPISPVSPNVLKNIIIGLALGAFVAMAVIVILFMMDDTVKTADDVEKYLGLNTLTSIPLREGEQKHKKGFGKKKTGKETSGK